MADLINREDILKVLQDVKRSAYEHWDIDTGNAFDEGISLVEKIPTIDIDAITKAHADIGYEQGYRDGYATAKPVSARWKGAGMGDYMCSRCAEVVSGNRYHYCPNCGARMDGGEND